MKISEALKIARARIATPDKWTQKCVARNTFGTPCYENSTNATCWCAAVAIRLAAPELFVKSLAFCEAVLPHGVSVPWFNDHNSHGEVLEMFDRAIVKAIASEA